MADVSAAAGMFRIGNWTRGNHTAAMDALARAIELKPSYADVYALTAWVLHFAGRPREGLVAMARAIDLNPRVPTAYQLVHLYLAAAYLATDELDEARWQVAEILTLNPDISLSDVELGAPIRDHGYKERFLNGLQRAGLFY